MAISHFNVSAFGQSPVVKLRGHSFSPFLRPEDAVRDPADSPASEEMGVGGRDPVRGSGDVLNHVIGGRGAIKAFA
jgi:hypothetical protein